jgi:membrane protease subunit (stomatin/prohibitin family)
MAIIDIVKYDGNDKEFVWKFPSDNLRLGSQLVVKQAQIAFFVKGGKVLDPFESGTHTLHSGNIPILHRLINIPFGGESPFQAEVWFVNLITKLDNKWGTITPLQLEDPMYGIVVPVRAYGQFGLKIYEPKLFLETLVGTVNIYSAEKIVEYFTGKIITTITTAIGKKIIQEKIPILQMSVLLEDLSKYCEIVIKEEFAKYGIDIVNFYIMSINVPEKDPSVVKLKEIKEKAMYINTVGKDVYSFDASMDVMKTAAGNEGNAGVIMGAGMGLGLGLGVGGNMGNQMGNISNQMNTNLQQNQQVTPPQPPIIQYFVLINNQQQGPFDFQQLQLMITQATIKKETLVWKQGMATWEKAENQQNLQFLFNQVPPPPPINQV